jgi:tetratricopeptide (TPR) repeat protein
MRVTGAQHQRTAPTREGGHPSDLARLLTCSVALGAILLFGLLVGCGASGEARAAFKAGERAMAAQDFRAALEHFRTSTTRDPEVAAAHLARGEAAEVLGEFDEALAAYQTAVRLSPSPTTRLRLGQMADRIGQAELAIQSLDGVQGPWRQHAAYGLAAGAATLVGCMRTQWPSLSAFWSPCLPDSIRASQASFRASRESVAEYAFRILIEAGRRGQAIELARSRGWVRDGVEYCQAEGLEISTEAAGLLAMLQQPDRADCLLPLGVQIADDGLVRLGRLVLQDRSQNSLRPDIRAQAAWALRYRLPAQDVVKKAESLNVTGWRLQNRLNRPAEAFQAFEKAIAADPTFSWPYHNIGRLYLSQKDYEQARVWLTKAVEVNPNHWRAQFNLGVAAARLKRYDEALAAYGRAATMDPSDASTYANIGWILLKLGREAEALRALQTAVRLDPTLDEARNYLNARFGRDARQGPTPFSVR